MSGSFDNDRFRKLLSAFPGKAIELLYDHYYRGLVTIALKLTKDQKASEDIVQETFVHVWENHKQLGQHHDRSIQHYLVKVVRYKSITHYKKSVRQYEQKDQYLNNIHLDLSELSIENRMIKKETSNQLREIIATFPAKERECLLMKMDEEMTNEQIAARLNVSKKAVERSITSAYKRLRKHFEVKE